MAPPNRRFTSNTEPDLSAFGGSGPAVGTSSSQQSNTGNFSIKGAADAFGKGIEQFSSDFTGMLGQAKGAIDGIVNSDPVISRLMGAGIDKGANPNDKLAQIAASSSAVGKDKDDHRVRLSLPPAAKIHYQKATVPYLLAPLLQTNGIIFPYTPQLIFQHNADYSRVSPTHSNYPLNYYSASNVSDISMFGEFVSETGPDAKYVLAVITFLRAVTKMFSNSDALAGNPPPILRLSGHGQYLLPNVPVVVNTVSITMPNNVDYISIPTGFNATSGKAATTRVPKSLDINVGLTPVYSREQLRSFGVDRMTAGQLIDPSTGGHI